MRHTCVHEVLKDQCWFLLRNKTDSAVLTGHGEQQFLQSNPYHFNQTLSKLKYNSPRIWHFKYTQKNTVLHSPLTYVTFIYTKMLLRWMD